jgi:uncharacterized protein YndB with AHSA1/START domain
MTADTIDTGIAKSVEVNAPPEELYHAVSTPEGLRAWWCKILAGDAETDGIVHLEFVGSGHRYRMRLVTARDPTLAKWRVEKHNVWKEWDGTEIVFKISLSGPGKSKLDVLHAGLTPQCECYGICEGAWGFLMGSFKGQLEGGKGTPA